MKYENYQRVPVYALGGEPLMPCHPAKARKLLASDRAVVHHVRGIFGIRLIDKTRSECGIQEVALNIDPGSRTSGFAVVVDSNNGCRQILGAYELKHRAHSIRAKMEQRRSNRRDRRCRLRHRQARFDNRRRRTNVIPPSIDSLRVDTLRLAETLTRIYPIALISIERNKFSIQFSTSLDVRKIGYQQGTLHGQHVKAYVFDRDNYECAYCGTRGVKFELDHVRPRGIGSNRVDNLITSCHNCNVSKGNRSIEEFLSNQPRLLERIIRRLQRSDLKSASHINTALPFIVRDLQKWGVPLYLADATTVAWNRQRFNIPKTHCNDAALHGSFLTNINNLPTRVIQITPANGRSKQKARTDRHGTPIGRFRDEQCWPKYQRHRNPMPGHSGKRQRYGPQDIATGDVVVLTHHGQTVVGRAVIGSRGSRATVGILEAKIDRCRLIARNPRHIIKRVTPSQQTHYKI